MLRFLAGLALLGTGIPNAYGTVRVLPASVTGAGAQTGSAGAAAASRHAIASLNGSITLSPSLSNLTIHSLSLDHELTASPLALPSGIIQPSVLAEGAESKAVVADAKQAPAESLRAVLSQQVSALGESRSQDSTGAGTRRLLNSLFHGRGSRGDAPVEVQFSAGNTVNDEGVTITGRAAQYYQEVRRIVDKYRGVVDLSKSLDVMDDTYADVVSKLAAMEALAKRRSVDDHNTHLEKTLTWIDGVMNDHGRSVAVHTYSVYFHHARNPKSEIREGIRRTDRYLEDTARLFLPGGKAEAALGSFDEIVLAFDTKGYAEIKAHIKSREKQFKKAFGDRFRFAYLDEIAELPDTKETVRAELNRLIGKYKNDEGLQKIIEGVTYSRYVGLLLELKTVEHYVDQGYDLLQGGHELFDEDGMYITELDLIVRSPEGKTSLVEAKSARVPLPFKEVLQNKILYKLDTYKKHWAALEEAAGGPIDEVVFSLDVGPNTQLVGDLRAKERMLSRKYGFPVRFLFIESSPQDRPSAEARYREKRESKRERKKNRRKNRRRR